MALERGFAGVAFWVFFLAAADNFAFSRRIWAAKILLGDGVGDAEVDINKLREKLGYKRG